MGAVDCKIKPAVHESAASAPASSGREEGEGSTRGGRRHDLHLENLFVLPEERRRGIARELVKGAERLARRKGAQAVQLEVNQANKAAMSLYRGCGFEKCQASGVQGESLGEALLRCLGRGMESLTIKV